MAQQPLSELWVSTEVPTGGATIFQHKTSDLTNCSANLSLEEGDENRSYVEGCSIVNLKIARVLCGRWVEGQSERSVAVISGGCFPGYTEQHHAFS